MKGELPMRELKKSIENAVAKGNTLIVNEEELNKAIQLKNENEIYFLEYLEDEEKPNYYELIDLRIVK